MKNQVKATNLFTLLLVSVAAYACSRVELQGPPPPTAADTQPAQESVGQHAQTLDRIYSRRLTAKYLLHLPREYGKDRAKRWPLIMYLHGGSLRGSNVDSVRVWGLPQLVEQDSTFPFIVVSPQAPQRTHWADDELLIGLLDEVIANYAVDSTRVYLTGHSMGGNGTWFLAYRHPERFAAIAPMSGPANPWWAVRLTDLPVWVFHGDQDAIVPLAESADMVQALREAGNQQVRFTVLPGRGHPIVDELYLENPALYQWFLQHSRE